MTATLLRQEEPAISSVYKSIAIQVEGVDSLMLHNGLLASPLNPVTRAMKQLTAKRTKKTERDIEMLAELEVIGGLYIARLDENGQPGEQATVQVEMGDTDFEFGLTHINPDGTEDRNAPLDEIYGNQIVMPAINLEALLVKGAKKSRLGTDFKTGVMVPADARIRHKYEQRKISTLLTEPDFVDSRLVVVQRNRIVRTRPLLKRWSVAFEVQYMPSVVNASQIEKALDDASLYVGMGDFAPRFGKFRVVNFKPIN